MLTRENYNKTTVIAEKIISTQFRRKIDVFTAREHSAAMPSAIL